MSAHSFVAAILTGTALALCAISPAAAATLRAVVTGTIVSDSQTLQPFDRETAVSGPQTVIDDARLGQTITITYEYEITGPPNPPTRDPDTGHLVGGSASTGSSLSFTVETGGESWSYAAYRGGAYQIGIDAGPEGTTATYGLSGSSSPVSVIDQWTLNGRTYAQFRSYDTDFLATSQDGSIPYALDQAFTSNTATGTGQFFFSLPIFADEPEGLRQVGADALEIAFRIDRLEVTPAAVPLPAPALLLAAPLLLGAIRARRR